MESKRLEAFSDGVIAIIITIMVLELKVPHDDTLAALLALWPVFVGYVLSFLYVGLYWNNHHHLFLAAGRVDGHVLWFNLFLLFWLSLLPFSTGWVGENHFSAMPMVVYGLNLLLAALAYQALEWQLIKLDGPDGELRRAVGRDIKGRASLAMYIAGILLSWNGVPRAGFALYVAVALLWLVPDRRMARVVAAREA